MKQNFTQKHILKYLDRIYKGTHDDRLMNEQVRCAILELIREACQIVNLSFSDPLQRLDFKLNDLTIEALEAFLAELRSIFWLQKFGFKDITPLQANKNTNLPDFTAKYKDKSCVIEVFCLTQTHEQQHDTSLGVYVNFDPGFKGSKFGRDFITAAQNKKVQLDSMEADIKILLCVLNSTPMISLNTKEEFDSHLKLLYDELQWPKNQNYYLGLLTGRSDIVGTSDDTIFPKLEE